MCNKYTVTYDDNIDLLDCFISKGQCSMFGANGTATVDKGLLQLRALDWNVDGQWIATLTITNVYTHCCSSYCTCRPLQELSPDHHLPPQLWQWACIC